MRAKKGCPSIVVEQHRHRALAVTDQALVLDRGGVAYRATSAAAGRPGAAGCVVGGFGAALSADVWCLLLRMQAQTYGACIECASGATKMAMLTARNIPDEVHRAPRARAAGHSLGMERPRCARFWSPPPARKGG